MEHITTVVDGLRICVRDESENACDKCPYERFNDVEKGAMCLDKLLKDCLDHLEPVEDDLK